MVPFYNGKTVPIYPLIYHVGYHGKDYKCSMVLLSFFFAGNNANNIYAGINGLEVAQSSVIAGSLILFNILELSGDSLKSHLFWLYFLIPYLTSSLALLRYNWNMKMSNVLISLLNNFSF